MHCLNAQVNENTWKNAKLINISETSWKMADILSQNIEIIHFCCIQLILHCPKLYQRMLPNQSSWTINMCRNKFDIWRQFKNQPEANYPAFFLLKMDNSWYFSKKVFNHYNFTHLFFLSYTLTSSQTWFLRRSHRKIHETCHSDEAFAFSVFLYPVSCFGLACFLSRSCPQTKRQCKRTQSLHVMYTRFSVWSNTYWHFVLPLT